MGTADGRDVVDTRDVIVEIDNAVRVDGNSAFDVSR